MADNQDLEKNAVAGGNAQQIQNFMTALNKVGAGSNNTFMQTSGPQAPQPVNPLVQFGANNGSVGAQTFGGVGPQPPPDVNKQPTSLAFGPPRDYTKSPTSLNFGPHPGSQTQQPNYPKPPSTGVNTSLFPPQYGPPPSTGVMQGPLNLPPLPQKPLDQQQAQPVPNNGVMQLPQLPQSSAPLPPQMSVPSQGFQQYLPQDFSNQPNYYPINQQQYQNVVMQLMSDENTKEDIKPADNQVQAFLNAIKAHSYKYKDEKHGVGTFTSPMAQELEETELGKQAVIETPEGKMVNYARLGGVTLAATAMLNERLNKLEKEFSKNFKRK